MEYNPMVIGIIGAGFSGTALAALIHQQYPSARIDLFDKTGQFGVGEAYRTPYPRHLLNVRAHDMSAFEGQANHFVDWLQASASAQAYLDPTTPISEQFVPRCLYRQYLADLLKNMDASRVTLVPQAVVDIMPAGQQALLKLQDGRDRCVDKVVLALGNNPPSHFPFPVAEDIQCIANPWDYTAIERIDRHAPVLIIGTGLSMIDAVLSLHEQQHQGPIYALSRHGLLPLPHTNNKTTLSLSRDDFPSTLRPLVNYLRKPEDWRAMVNALRVQLPALWQSMSAKDKKQFLRHVLPYWNVHRHRVHEKIAALLVQKREEGQLAIFSGRVLSVGQGNATIQLRKTQEKVSFKTTWLINCMGPTLHIHAGQQPLMQSLLARQLAVFDALQLGFATTPAGALVGSDGNTSSLLYTLGPPAKATTWECTAVPDIRRQCAVLAQELFASP